VHSAVLIAVLAFGGDRAPAEVDCREDFPARCTSGLNVKQPAPFAGVLLTGDLAAHLFLVEKNQQRRIDAAVKKEHDDGKIKLDHEKDLRAIDRESFDDKLKVMKEAHERDLENVRPSWYEHPAFVIPVAVAATLGAVWLSVEVLEARK